MQNNAIVSMLRLPNLKDWKLKFDELKILAQTAGYHIVDEIIQYKPKVFSSTLFGKGKIEEIKIRAEENNADTLIVWNSLNSIQKLNLERFTELRVIDRYELVLEIFDLHAGDNLAKLQIELAYLEKLIPYFKLREKLVHGASDKPYFKAGGQYGWIPKVAWLRHRRKKIKSRIRELLKMKLMQIEKRKSLGFKIVALIGYYNVGKTSLFNALTGERKRVSSEPFTTLASKYSRMLGNNKILMVDTIGFVSDLDPKIISSFKINIEDIANADLLLWVVDISVPEPLLRIHIKTTTDILERNDLLEKRFIVVANKIDLLSGNRLVNERINYIKSLFAKIMGNQFNPPVIPCSAKSEVGLESLIKAVADSFS